MEQITRYDLSKFLLYWYFYTFRVELAKIRSWQRTLWLLQLTFSIMRKSWIFKVPSTRYF